MILEIKLEEFGCSSSNILNRKIVQLRSRHDLSTSFDAMSVHVLLRDDTGAGAGLDWKNLEGESSSLMGSRTVLSLSLFPASSCGSTRSGVFPLVSTITLS